MQDYYYPPVRVDLPASRLPYGTEHIGDRPIKVKTGNSTLPFVATLALGLPFRPADEYLNPETLHAAYQSAYRLLFARTMAKWLAVDAWSSAQTVEGVRSTEIEALQVIPGFAYFVEGLLLFNFTVAVVILFRLRSRDRRFLFNPSSIASVMSLSADNDELLQTLVELDSRPEAEFKKSLEQHRFRANLGSSFTITLLPGPSPPADHRQTSQSVNNPGVDSRFSRAVELGPLRIGIFMALHIIALAIFSTLYALSKPYGKSSSHFQLPAKVPLRR
jgi:hypothetical protein